MNTINAPEALTRNANTFCECAVAAKMPSTPARLPIHTERVGTRRALSWTSHCGASPFSASTNSTREHT